MKSAKQKLWESMKENGFYKDYKTYEEYQMSKIVIPKLPEKTEQETWEERYTPTPEKKKQYQEFISLGPTEEQIKKNKEKFN